MRIRHVSLFFFFKQKTAYEMRISDWSSDVCSSDLAATDQMISEQTAERAEREVGTRMCGRSRLRRLFLDQFECGARDAETQGADFLDAGIDRHRKRVVSGTRVSVLVDLGADRTVKKKRHERA